MHNLPSIAVRKELDDPSDIPRFQVVVNIAISYIERVCSVLFPANPTALLELVWDKCHRVSAEVSPLERDMILTMQKLPRRSIERRTLGAILANSMTQKKLRLLCMSVTENEIAPKSTTFARMKKDCSRLASGGILSLDVKFARKFDKDVAEKAVKYILSIENTQIIAWGERNIIVGNQKIVLPKITRKRIAKYMHDGYLAYTSADKERIGRSKFFEIVNALTANDMKSMTAVDYATGVLVNDSCDRLLKFFQSKLYPLEERRMTKLLHVLSTILKLLP